MKANVGGIDKVLRIVAGVALLGLGVAGVLPMWVGLIGLVPLVTGLMNWCPAYALLGLNSCPMEKK
ncbi:MAG: DUF2892 domain-containing protein [Hydrogenophilales bacterium CG_4_9_14_3_um_filter_59_35]|nr:MAG: hypothetical protein COW70_06015 [Hydrogenophilales bacterium CG18_big_fil_WC_8_21_14_2_50_58_12]PJB04850.1 MAG: DUF2892 domain-containing protein [Hydrogenophilales bacterium CG_4_9_14_3_um_filter_59_35]